jgi:hypothetical protein
MEASYWKLEQRGDHLELAVMAAPRQSSSASSSRATDHDGLNPDADAIGFAELAGPR